MIFRKTLVLSAEARQKAEGNSDAIIHTLMRFHAGNVSSFLLVFHLLIWSAPLQILLYGTRLHARAVLGARRQRTHTRCSSVIFLGNLLDFESTLAGLLVLIVLVLINNFLSVLQVDACSEPHKLRPTNSLSICR